MIHLKCGWDLTRVGSYSCTPPNFPRDTEILKLPNRRVCFNRRDMVRHRNCITGALGWQRLSQVSRVKLVSALSSFSMYVNVGQCRGPFRVRCPTGKTLRQTFGFGRCALAPLFSCARGCLNPRLSVTVSTASVSTSLTRYLYETSYASFL